MNKKYFILILLIAFLTGCNKDNNMFKNKTKKEEKTKEVILKKVNYEKINLIGEDIVKIDNNDNYKVEKIKNEDKNELKITVYFDYDGGLKEKESIDVTYMKNYGILPNAKKEGYTFLGWYTKDNKKINNNSNVEIKENHTLYAHYIINSYSIKYDYNYLGNNLYNDLDNKDKWSEDYEVVYNDNLFENQNVLKFSINNKKISYNQNLQLEEGETYTYSVFIKTNVTKELKIGFKNDLLSINTNENYMKFTKTFKASKDNYNEFLFEFNDVFENDYIMIYDLSISKGNLNIRENNKNYNEIIKDFEIPKREGYTFDGWYKDITFKDKVENDIVLSDKFYYAKWKANTYTLKLNLNGGNIEGDTLITGGYNTKIKLKEPINNYKITYYGDETKEVLVKRKFKGWVNKNNEFVDNEYIFNISTTLKAVYSDNEQVKLNSTEKKDYTCQWNTKKNGLGNKYNSLSNIQINNDLTLYEICAYNIKFERPINSGYVTSEYGYRLHPISKTNKFHSGIDMSGNDKSIYPILPGKVVSTGNNSSMGNYIIIHHIYNNQNYTSAYYHLEKKYVRKGQNVTQSTIIGKMGTTGASTGIHLHLTMYKGHLYNENTIMINPRDYLNFPSKWNNKRY